MDTEPRLRNRLEELEEVIAGSATAIEKEFTRTANDWLSCFGSRIFVIETYLSNKKIEQLLSPEQRQTALDRLQQLKIDLHKLKSQYPEKETVPPHEIKDTLLNTLNTLIPRAESFENLHEVTLFVVRHGKTAYLERAHVERTNTWNPDLPDLTKEGERDVDETAEDLSKQIDPKKHIVVFFSSPRARALRSQERLALRLQEKGFEIFDRDPKAEILRSGGDKAPLVGKGNAVEFRGEQPEDWDIAIEDEQETQGKRFREFLSYFSAIDKAQLLKSIRDPRGKYHHKIPVFIAVTHGEVTHAGINPTEQYQASFLGTAFPEYERMKLFRGKAMRLDFDLNIPGNITLTLPSEMSPVHQEEKKLLHFDSKNGKLQARSSE